LICDFRFLIADLSVWPLLARLPKLKPKSEIGNQKSKITLPRWRRTKLRRVETYCRLKGLSQLSKLGAKRVPDHEEWFAKL
jgi:hypothetical protein